jgi:hypothetical protein
MKLVEVTQPTPEVIRLFLEPRLQAGNLVLSLLNSLGKEKASNFSSVNQYLESSLGDANRVLEEMSNFQIIIEQSKAKGFSREIETGYEDVKARAQSNLVELHRAKIKLNDLKIALCRFIINYESPSKNPVRHYHSVEEWMDAATLSEMRLTRSLNPNGERDLQRLLALFMTFRSIVCSYDGPSMYIRQIENSIASLDAIYEKVRLEMEILKANRRLTETRRELSTAKINLTQLQTQLQQKDTQTEQLAKLMSLQEKPSYSKWVFTGMLLGAVAGFLGYVALADFGPAKAKAGDYMAQKSCKEIYNQIQKSPRYASQVLIFRKFGNDVYFRANPATCEKLHRLDSLQMNSLTDLMKADYDAGNQGAASFHGNRVLQVKDVGINKLVVKLSNHTELDMRFKLKVLELATTLRAILQPDKAGAAEDLLIVDLSHGRSNEL